MVGHPSIYLTEALLGARSNIGHEHEDTQLSIDFEQRGLRQGIAPVTSNRIAPNSGRESIDKWRGYGRGYRDLVSSEPGKRRAIVRHIVWTIPFVRGWRPVKRGHLTQPFFAFIMAASISYGFVFPKR
jgi:hypothetical protein